MHVAATLPEIFSCVAAFMSQKAAGTSQTRTMHNPLRKESSMNLPRFTAEAALYQTNGHYHMGRQINYSSLQTVSSISPAEIRGEAPIDVPGETIPISECRPGWIDIGGTCWPAPLTEPSSGGSSGQTGGGSSGGGPGGGASGGGAPPKGKPKTKRFFNESKVPPKQGFKPKEGRTCYGQKTEIGAGGDPIITDIPYTVKGTYTAGIDSWNCQPKSGDAFKCNVKHDWNNGDQDIYHCYNERPPSP